MNGVKLLEGTTEATMLDEIKYKQYRIQAVPLEASPFNDVRPFDEWRPRACVMWSDDNSDFEQLVVDDGPACDSREEAVQISFEIARLYVDANYQ